MSRPTIKADLIIAVNQQFDKLWKLIETMSEDMQNATFSDELFAKKHFAWTGTSSLGAYCVSATSNHYDWAIKKLKLHAKTWK